MNPAPTNGDTMAAYAQGAVNFVQSSLHQRLDFSEDSIKTVEEILGRYQSELPRASPTPETIDLVCNIFGAYIGEVMRRNVGGEWVLDDRLTPGSQTISLLVGHMQTMPSAKVCKRIMNGAEDDVCFYYRCFTEECLKNGSKKL